MSIRELGVPLFETILGEYHLGLLHATTIHERFSESGRSAALGTDDLRQRITSLHEMLHALQDMMTGFGAFVSTQLDDLVCCVRAMAGYLGLKSGSITIPLEENVRQLSAQEKQLFQKMISNCSALEKNLQFIQRPNSQGVGVREILEGTAAFFSAVAERYSRWAYFNEPAPSSGGYVFEEICQAVAQRRPPYTAFVADYYQWSKRLPQGVSDRQKSNLLFILQDIALDIPSMEVIVARSKSGTNKLEDFIPAFRYRKTMDVILESRLPIPDLPSPPIVPGVTAWAQNHDGFAFFPAGKRTGSGSLLQIKNLEEVSKANRQKSISAFLTSYISILGYRGPLERV